MKQAYLAIKYHSDHRNRPLIELVTQAFAQNRYQTHCVTRDLEQWGVIDFPPAVLMQKSFALIDQSAWVVIELTEKGVGLGIEAGYAHAKQIPILTIAPVGADISTTLRGISHTVIHYRDSQELAAQLRSIL